MSEQSLDSPQDDAAEQGRIVVPDEEASTPDVPIEAPEADFAEQHATVTYDEDEYR